MAFKMKGSPAKMGTINGTAGHSSALKMKMEKDAAAKLKKESAMKLKEKSPAKHMRSASQKLKHGGGVSQMEFDSVERHNKAHKSGQFDSDHRRPKGKGKYVTKSDDMDKTTNQLTVENLRKKEAREKAKKEVDKKVKDVTSIGKNLASGAKMKKKSAMPMADKKKLAKDKKDLRKKIKKEDRLSSKIRKLSDKMEQRVSKGKKTTVRQHDKKDKLKTKLRKTQNVGEQSFAGNPKAENYVYNDPRFKAMGRDKHGNKIKKEKK